MVAFKVLLFFATAIFTAAKPAHSTPVVDEQKAIPTGFALNGPAPPDVTLNLRLLLKANNLTGLETVLYDVSTPGSKNYGKYLTYAEANSYIAPSAATKSAVDEWLTANGIQATPGSAAGDWLNFTIPVSKANDLFDANFSSFTDQATGKDLVRTLTYSIPANLTSHVRLLYPASVFPIPPLSQPMATLANLNATSDLDVTPNAVPESCADLATPDCILALYGIPRTVGSQSASRIGVVGVGEYPIATDLASFLNTFRPDLVPRPSFDSVNITNGFTIAISANAEVQYTVGIAGGVPVTFYLAPGNYIDDLLSLSEAGTLPQVVSTSFSFDESSFTELQGGTEYLQHLCERHMVLSSRGVSFLAGTGTGGVGGAYSETECSIFNSTFPSSCPYVTAVGATQRVNPEIAAEFSNGGFSSIFSIPDYQHEAVSSYLSKIGSLYPGKFNRSGRAYPDISAHGENLPFEYNGKLYSFRGPWFSTAIVASVVAQVNALRIKRNEPVLGFLNPKIYSTPSLATDIINGSNPGCGTDGFPALSGWDPVTGVGTPNFIAFDALP